MADNQDGVWHYYGPHDKVPAWVLDAEESVFNAKTQESWHKMPTDYKYPGPLWRYDVGAFPVAGPGQTEPVYALLSIQTDEVDQHGSR